MDQTNPPQDAAPGAEYTALTQIPLPKPGPIPDMPAELCGALVAAQTDIQMVGKGGWNDHHKYKYASGDDMIAEARRVLNLHGVAAIPVRWVMAETPYEYTDFVDDKTEDGRGATRRAVVVQDVQLRLFVTIRLVHKSGIQHLCEPFHVPVIPDRGRPLDKAESAARTYALSYFLRDLLQIPRGDEDKDAGSVDQRDDRDRNYSRARTQPAAQPARDRNKPRDRQTSKNDRREPTPDDYDPGRDAESWARDEAERMRLEAQQPDGYGQGGPSHLPPDDATDDGPDSRRTPAEPPKRDGRINPEDATEADLKRALDSLKADYPDDYPATAKLLATGYGAPAATPWQIVRGKHADAFKEIKAAYKRASRAKAGG